MSFKCFTRKKQDKRKSLEQSSISAGNSPLRGPRVQRPVSQNLNVAPRTSAYEGAPVKEWECGLCRKELVEPRLLACLHSFCTGCLQGLHQEGEVEEWSEIDGGSIRLEGEVRSSCAGSAGSGYESDLRHSGSEGSWDHRRRKYGIFTRRVSGKSVQFLLCPACNHETPLPLGGIAALPLNYILLRKMVAAGRDDSANVLCDLCNSDNKCLLCPTCHHETPLPLGGIAALPLNYILLRKMVAAGRDDSANVLCDLCNSDNKAESKCDQCLVSVCSSCSEAHGRHKATARHSLRPLGPLPQRHCSLHPRAELSVYCATCQQVICRDCCIVSHSGHALASAARASAERARQLRDACERARHVPDHVERALRIVHAQAFEADTQAAHVESEVQAWAEQYRRAVDAHARTLCAAAAAARDTYRRRVDRHTTELQDCATHAVDAVKFAEEVLKEAREDELLSLSNAVSRRLEKLTELHSLEAPRCELRFAPSAPAAADPRLVGRLLTRAPHHDHCVLNTDGKCFWICAFFDARSTILGRIGVAIDFKRLCKVRFMTELHSLEAPRFAPSAPAAADPRLVGRLLMRAPHHDHCVLNTDGLQDLRVDIPHDAILELRDNNGERIWCGGEQVAGYFRRRDSCQAPAAARVRDRGDGTYCVRVTPRAPGAYLLAVTLQNQPIKGSPFPCAARVAKAHTGQFHCCAFCSSGGRRDAVCGCGATMPGGYKGCGHGHAGWPGARHWSCCGSTRRRGACTHTARPNTPLYQFSL